MLSPTVLRFAAIGSIVGIIALTVNGFINTERDVSTGDILVAAFAVGAPVFGTAGAAFGFIWERMSRSRRAPRQEDSNAPLDEDETAPRARRGAPTAKRGPGGGRRRRRRR